METIQDFLNKLDKLSFTSYEDKTLHTAEEFDKASEYLKKVHAKYGTVDISIIKSLIN